MSNRRKSSRAGFALPVMPDRTITMLSLVAGALMVAYVALVITTITFATLQTSLASQVRETEGGIATLESTYYSAIAKQNATTPGSIGLVAPSSVEYTEQAKPVGLSFAGE